MNNLGHVVGESGGNENSYLDMWIWTPERGNEDLDPLIDPALQIVLTGVSAINDAGQIIARGISQLPPAPGAAVILTPVALPCAADWNHSGSLDSRISSTSSPPSSPATPISTTTRRPAHRIS